LSTRALLLRTQSSLNAVACSSCVQKENKWDKEGALPYCIGIIAGGHLIDNKHVDKKTGRIQCEHGVAPLGLSAA